MRADAVRNCAAIINAARELVAQHGAEVTMDAVAERAGVAVGTLYRHFPAKQDLIAAIIEGSVARIADAAQAALARARAGSPPGAEFARLFRQVADWQATDRAVKAAASGLGEGETSGFTRTDTDSSAGRAQVAITGLLHLAVSAGQIRADVTIEDFIMLISQLPDRPPAMRDRYLGIALAGLGVAS